MGVPDDSWQTYKAGTRPVIVLVAESENRLPSVAVVQVEALGAELPAAQVTITAPLEFEDGRPTPVANWLPVTKVPDVQPVPNVPRPACATKIIAVVSDVEFTQISAA